MNRFGTLVGALAVALTAAATAHAEVEDVKTPRGGTVRILVEKLQESARTALERWRARRPTSAWSRPCSRSRAAPR